MNRRPPAQHPGIGTDPGDTRVLHLQQDPTRPHPVIDLVEAWLAEAHRLISRSPPPGIVAACGLSSPSITLATYERWRRDLRLWARYCADVEPDVSPDAGTAQRFRAWVALRRSPRAVNNVLAAMQRLYAWAHATGRSANVMAGIDLLAPPARTIPAVDPSAPNLVREVVGCLTGDGVRALRDRALLLLLSGLPVDTIALRRALVGAFDPVTGTLRVRARGHRTADTVLALAPDASEALQRYLAARGDPGPRSPLFTGTRAPWTDHAMSLVSMRLVLRRSALAVSAAQPVPTRYPQPTAEDLERTERDADPANPAVCRRLSLLHLLALAQERRCQLALHHLTWDRLADGQVVDVRSRQHPLSAEARRWIDGWRAGAPGMPWVFPARDGNPLCPSSLRAEAWRALGQESVATPTSRDLRLANLLALADDQGPAVTARSCGLTADQVDALLRSA